MGFILFLLVSSVSFGQSADVTIHDEVQASNPSQQRLPVAFMPYNVPRIMKTLAGPYDDAKINQMKVFGYVKTFPIYDRNRDVVGEKYFTASGKSVAIVNREPDTGNIRDIKLSSKTSLYRWDLQTRSFFKSSLQRNSNQKMTSGTSCYRPHEVADAYTRDVCQVLTSNDRAVASAPPTSAPATLAENKPETPAPAAPTQIAKGTN